MKLLRNLLALALLPFAVQAQIILPKPAAPAPVSPAVNATLPGVSPGMTRLQLQWNQWGAFGTPLQPLPTFFVVCIKPASQLANCTFAPADFLPVASVSSIKLYNGFQFAGYQYTLDLPRVGGVISDALLDIDLTLSIGACRGAGASACSFSAPRALFLSARDLKADNVSDGNTTSTDAVFDHEFKNLGSTEIPSIPFHVHVTAWQAMLNANSQCRVDYDDLSLMNNANVIVFLENGDGRWLVDLPIVNGRRLAPGLVVGMHLWNGGVGVFADNPPFGFRLPSTRQGSVTLSFALPNAQRPRGYINVTRADSSALVREYDESNNSKAECNVVPRDG